MSPASYTTPSLQTEILPDRPDGDRAISHSGGDASRRPVADVAGREHAGQAGLEGVRSSGQPPSWLTGGIADDVPSGEDVALRIALDRVRQLRLAASVGSGISLSLRARGIASVHCRGPRL